ncbi:MAG: SEC-C domain-containing protein [Myxococcales bacterium]|nr:SEC-C domain-containing protein [Myxococcales bacterium]
MTQIGRNAPCSCGSGKKYKSCCLVGGRQSYTAGERQSALDRLPGVLEAAGFKDRVPALAEQFGLLFPDPDTDELIAGMSFDAFRAWLLFDVPIDADARMVDRLLAGGGLGRGERMFLEGMSGTAMRLYEVVDVVPGATVSVRELLDGGELVVRERSASRSLKRGDILAARVSPRGATGQPEFDGGLLPLYRSRREAVLRRLRDAQAEFRAARPLADELEFARTLPPLFHAEWSTSVSAPQLVNFDDEPVVLVQVKYRVRDVPGARAALDAHPDLERSTDGARWAWRAPSREKRDPVILASFTLDDDELSIDTNSRERSERVQALVAGHLGELVTLKGTTFTEPTPTATGTHERPTASPPAVPPELRAVVEQALARHYAAWLDEPVPALDRHTPRAAARTAKLRPRVVEMLKDLEQNYERDRCNGQPAFDPAPLWDELGLRGAEMDGSSSSPSPVLRDRVTPGPHRRGARGPGPGR